MKKFALLIALATALLDSKSFAAAQDYIVVNKADGKIVFSGSLMQGDVAMFQNKSDEPCVIIASDGSQLTSEMAPGNGKEPMDSYSKYSYTVPAATEFWCKHRPEDKGKILY